MKCPKCGYLGFETTDRCRNCGYDFSLAVPPAGRELPLRSAPADQTMVDLALQAEAESAASKVGDWPVSGPSTTSGIERAGLGTSPLAVDPSVEADSAPAEELPLFAPRPAGQPLAVRRPGTEVPRARRTTTTRPQRQEAPALPLVADAPSPAPAGVAKRRQPRQEVASAGGRLVAGLIDLVLLTSIDVGVLWLTTRIAGLELSREDLAVIRPLPMAGFFLVLAFLYLVGFTVGGGQTIGKMALGIRVIGDDEHGVDLTGAVVRAFGTLASVGVLGLLFVPVIFTTDRRAIYDRLAGTRVVIG